ncbi:MAG: hypothetical protein ACE5DO_11410 [Desulfobacterales bacterium]
MAENYKTPSLLCCCLLLIAAPAQAQLNEKIAFPRFYTFHAGDDTAWAQPDFDDSDWEQIDIDAFPFGKRQGIGWARYSGSGVHTLGCVAGLIRAIRWSELKTLH